MSKGQELEGVLYDALAPLADHPLVAEVRGGLGLLAAVELDAALLERRPRSVWDAYIAVRDQGVLLRPLVRGLAVSPPLTITPEEIGTIADATRAGLDELARIV